MAHENQNMVAGLTPIDVLVSWPSSDAELEAAAETPDLYDFSADPFSPAEDSPLDQRLND